MSSCRCCSRFATTLLQLVASRSAGPSSSSSSSSSPGADWLYALETADHFNSLLSDFGLAPEASAVAAKEDGEGGEASTASTVVRTLIHGRRHRGAHLHENFSPSSALLAARPITSSRILQVEQRQN